MPDDGPNIIALKKGRIGHIQLDRPKALNSLGLDMIRVMHRALKDWEHDESVEAVLISGAGDRAFCAGGDVKSVYLAGKTGQLGRDGTLAADFFRQEYTLDYQVASFPKPYVAYLDGITMGGGVGISIWGSHRIASEHTRLAMPETAIGFFPDVGASWFLSRPGPIGVMLALTGEHLDASAAIELGFATHFVPRRAGAELIERMAADGVEATLSDLCQQPPKSQRVPRLKEIADRCFAASTMEEIVESLTREVNGSAADSACLATEILQTLRTRSPTSLKVTLEELRRGRGMALADCLMMEYRISQACVQGHDFYEGIRAMLVDKDRSPKWSPDSIEKVEAKLVARHFEELGDRDLKL